MLKINYTITRQSENIVRNTMWKNVQDSFNDDSKPVKAFEGHREFDNDKDADKFLQRLAIFKMKLAFRCANEKFTKMSDGFKKSNSLYTFGSYDYKKSANNAAKKNVYRMSVSIEHLKLAA